jgi:rhodanese-related sulfurtransferase
LLVNVMQKEAFEDGHIPRSIKLPLSEIETKARQLFPDVAGARLSSTVVVPPNLWANRRSVCSRAWLQK